MSKIKYSIGIDYGTLSARAVLVDISNGNEVATAVFEYPHGAMDETLPCGLKLPKDYALFYPLDYEQALEYIIPKVIASVGADPKDIVGIGIDCTSCSVIPLDKDMKPLCYQEKYISQPHAYGKLWKHHGAQKYADRIYDLAVTTNQPWLEDYGGKISSEWFFPKVIQVLEEAPEVYKDTYRFIEAGDWLVMLLTGGECKNSCAAGYKAMWSRERGWPDDSFLEMLNPELKGIVGDKISENVTSSATLAGYTTKESVKYGLVPGIPVAAAFIDAHAALPGMKVTAPGKMLMILGTSSAHILLSEKGKAFPGICGIVKDGVVPGYYAYESGQCAVGDIFSWFVDNCLPASYVEQAKKENKGIHRFLREKAQKLRPGESGLVALDWFNGNRSVLVDSDLSGMILGMTLKTKPEEIYRALIEATAFGTKVIIDSYESNGIPIGDLYAAGGIAAKDEMMMQIYADVTGRNIYIGDSMQIPALGSAIAGAGISGYYDNISLASENMGKIKSKPYVPDKENVILYERLYKEYVLLHDYFGIEQKNIMKRLKELK